MPNKRVFPFIISKGFTIVELMVVISLMAIMTGVIMSVINTKGTRDKTRDGQRKSDLAKIQTALEVYFTDNMRYPATSAVDTFVTISGTDAMSTALTGGKYITKVPADPKNPTATDICDSVSGPYAYYTNTNGTLYVLATEMDVTSSANTSLCSKVNTTFGASISSICSGSPPVDCYAITSPSH